MRFRFRLQRTLEWQRAEEQAALNQMRATGVEIQRTEAALRELRVAGARRACDLASQPAISGAEIGALAAFADACRRRQNQLVDRLAELAQRELREMAAHRDARRRRLLLERLELRKRIAFDAEQDRAAEEFSTEAYLAAQVRERSQSVRPSD